MATINEIKEQAAAVKNATQVGENTAERVGGALAGLAEIAEQQDSKLSDLASGVSISPQSETIFDVSKMIDITASAETLTGLYGFGQGLNDTPLYSAGGETKKIETIDFQAADRGWYIYLEGCSVANSEYRTYAVYNKDGKLIREGVSTTNLVLYVKQKVTILACCNKIYRATSDTHFETINDKIKPLGGKTFWTIFDSLGHNTWQQHFVDISGAVFYSDLNVKPDKPISWGGSDSYPSSDDSTQPRAVNLVSYKDDYPIDYVFIENINDRGNGNLGTINDIPFMRTQKLVYTQAGNLTSYNEAYSYLQNHKSDIIASVSGKMIGTIISIPYQGGNLIRGSKVKFLTRPSTEGDITININGLHSVHVTPSMTIQNIVDEFIKYSYGAGWTDIDNGDGSISIFFYTETSVRATFDGGTTGVTAEVTDTTGGGYANIYYVGESADAKNWNNTDNWVNGVSLCSIYKGLIEYLQTEIPQAKLYWVAPFAESIDFSSDIYKKSNGTWSQDKFRNSDTYKSHRKLYDAQKSVCEYYNIPFLDLGSLSGMSILNIETFFNTNNVHPKSVGYDRYAETILGMLTS